MKRLIAVLLSPLVLSGCNANEMKTSSNEIRIACQANSSALAEGAVVLDCTARNESSRTLRLLPWNTPLEPQLRGRFLKVTNADGEQLNYRGMMVKRAAPTDDDYLILDPGQTVENSLDLTISYSFCPNTSYRINYDSQQWNAEGDEFKLRMPTVEFSTTEKFSPCG